MRCGISVAQLRSKQMVVNLRMLISLDEDGDRARKEAVLAVPERETSTNFANLNDMKSDLHFEHLHSFKCCVNDVVSCPGHSVQRDMLHCTQIHF